MQQERETRSYHKETNHSHSVVFDSQSSDNLQLIQNYVNVNFKETGRNK